MKIAIFTPTKRWGGIDVSVDAIRNQLGQHDLIWIIGDDHLSARASLYDEISRDLCPIVYFDTSKKREGYYSELPRWYNMGFELAMELDVELFVSLQDYIWLPPGNLEKFVFHSGSMDSLLTGITHITNNPEVEKVIDPEGLYTVFVDPFIGPPDINSLLWRDVRSYKLQSELDICFINPISWELNWAAIPMNAVRDGLRFDEDFGRGQAYENQALAAEAETMNYSLLMIGNSVAYSLPHRLYFADEWEEQIPHQQANKIILDDKWSL